MLLSCYLRNRVVYIPTFGKVPGGPYRQIEPVAVVPVADIADLRRSVQEALARGNPEVPNLLRAEHGDPIIPKYAGVRTYSAFARPARHWLIDEKQGVYRIIGQRKLPRGGWVDDPAQTVTFSAGSSADDMIDRMIAILQEAAG